MCKHIQAYKRMYESHSYFSPDEVYISLRSGDGNYFAVSSKSRYVKDVSEIIILNSECKIVEGSKSDFDTLFFSHYLIYKAYPFIHCIVKSDSKWLSVWAGTGLALPPVTQLHTRHFFGEIACVKKIPDVSDTEVFSIKIAKEILSTLKQKFVYQTPAIFIHTIGAFAWGKNSKCALDTLINLEEIAERTYLLGLTKRETFTYISYEYSLANYMSSTESISPDSQIQRLDLNEQWIKNCHDMLK